MNATLTSLLADPFVLRGLVALVVKATVLSGLGLAVIALMRRESAARRHLALALVLGGLVALPFLELVVPAWYAGASVARLSSGVLPALAPAVTAAPEAALAARTSAAPFAPEAPLAALDPDAPLDAMAPSATEASLAPFAATTADLPAVADAAPAATAAPAASSPWSLRGIILALWLVGSLVVGIFFVYGRLCVQRWAKRAEAITEPDVLDVRLAVMDTLGIRRRVRFVWADVATPMTWGVLRPVVALPHEARAWTSERLRLVLLHELTHVARFDAVSQGFAHGACTLFWFNPLVWKAARQLMHERELACDDAVLERGARASSYAQHLLDVARNLRRPIPVPVAVLALARKGELEGRLTAILSTGRRRGGLRRIHTFLASLLVLVLVLPLAAFKPWDAPFKTQAVQKLKDAFASNALVERAAALVGISNEAPAASPEDGFVGSAEGDLHCEGTGRAGGQLTLRTDVGSVEVRTWNQNRIEVDLEQNIGARFRSTCRITNGSATVEGRLDRSNRWNWGRNQRVRYIVRVPERFNVNVNTSGGSIEVGDLEGRATVHTSGGSLSLGSIQGVVQAHTSGGSISLARASGNARLETSGGSVSVGDVTGDLYVHTSGGSISLNGGATGKIDASTSGGSVEAMLARQPRGDVRLETSGGGVRVGVADGLRFDVDAATSAGRVRSSFHTSRPTESLRGEIGGGGPLLRLRTSAGNIEISRSGRSSSNRTGLFRGRTLTEAEQARVEAELATLDLDLDLDLDLGDIHVEIDEADLNRSVHKGLAAAQRALAGAQPEIDRALREALPQAQREIARALAQSEREQTRALAEADRERTQALREAERDLQQSLREISAARSMPRKQRDEVLREARRVHQEALREADQERQEALREAQREIEDAQREAQREAERDRREAQRERTRTRTGHNEISIVMTPPSIQNVTVTTTTTGTASAHVMVQRGRTGQVDVAAPVAPVAPVAPAVKVSF